MLVKFFRHGKGSGAGPINYLLGSDRQRADAKVLYGDPMMTEQLINTTPFKQKYKSGVLSFTERANELTDKQKMDIMQRFENTLFAGLETDQYDILWIEHSDKNKENEKYGRLELNFVIPCQELRSGKSLQPFFAGADLVRINALKNIINHEYKLTNPDNPIRKRDINPHINNGPRPTHSNNNHKNAKKDEKQDDDIIQHPSSHQLLKEAIDRKMRRLLDQGLISNRFEVSYQLRQWGLTIERETKSSMSVSHPNINKNIRLKGFIYEKNFDSLKAQPEVKALYQENFEQNSSRQYQDNLKTWQTGMTKKEAYNQKLYSDIKAPEPLDIVIATITPDSELPVAKPRPGTPTPQRSYSPRP